MPKFMIEALSQYRMVYAIEAETKDEALEYLEQIEYLDELGQQWLGEIILSTREVSDTDIVKTFDELNDYLVDQPIERKLGYVHKVIPNED